MQGPTFSLPGSGKVRPYMTSPKITSDSAEILVRTTAQAVSRIVAKVMLCEAVDGTVCVLLDFMTFSYESVECGTTGVIKDFLRSRQKLSAFALLVFCVQDPNCENEG